MQTSWLLRAFTFHITFFGLLLALATNAMGQEATLESRVESWLEERLQEARRPLAVEGITLTWQVSHPPSGTPEDLARLRQLVAGKPIHPLRAEIERLERELEYGPPLEEFTLWHARQDRWRLNRDVAHQPEIPYVDVARKGGLTWSTTPDHANIVEIDSAPPGYDYTLHQQTFSLQLNSFLLTNLDAASRFGARVVEVRSADQKMWTALLRSRDGKREYHLSGYSEEGTDQPLVTLQELIYADSAGETRKRAIEYGHWRFDELLDRWVPGEVVHFKEDGQPWFSLYFGDSTAHDQAELTRLLEPPTPSGADPVRGAYTFRSLNDFRPDVQASTFVSADGELTEGSLPVAPRQSATRLRQVGWGVMATLVAILVGIRLWRRR